MTWLKSLAISAALVIATATGAFAAGNQVYIDQVGNNANISVTQTGSDNQLGTNTDPAIMHGNNQAVTIAQIGSTNVTAVNLQGAGTTLTSTVTGSNNTVNIDCGSGNVHKASACADSSVTANATGDNNSLQISAGSKSTHSQDVTGDRNTVSTDSITSNLLGARSSMTVTGSDNTVNISQTGPGGSNGFDATVAVTGSSNTVGVTQSGTVDSKVNVATTGSNNTISVTQGN